MRTFDGVDELKAAVGEQLGTSDWMTVDQKQVDTFADATGDHQWIHVDPERAEDGPFGRTIAHGYLTISLVPSLVGQVFRVDGVKMGINYGSNKVRFTNPVPVGSRIRAAVTIVDVSEVTGGVQVATGVTVEIDGVEKPALVAETIVRYYL